MQNLSVPIKWKNSPKINTESTCGYAYIVTCWLPEKLKLGGAFAVNVNDVLDALPLDESPNENAGGFCFI